MPKADYIKSHLYSPNKARTGLKLTHIFRSFLKLLGIPLFIFANLALAVGLLFSDKLTLIIFSLTVAFAVIFLEPFIGVLLYIIFLYVRPTELLDIPNIPLMKILALTILTSWVLHILVYRKREFVNAPQNYLMFAFLGIIVISQRIYVQGMIDELTGDFARIVIIYFLMINLINNERRLKATIWILVISTFWLSLHSILLSRGIIIGQVELLQDNRVKSSGIFGDPNDLAQAIVVAIPFLFNLMFYERGVLIKLILGIIGTIMLYSFLLTGSRGGFIGLAVVMFLLLKKKVGIAIGSALGVVALVGLLFIAPSNTVERMKTASPYEDTGAARIELWYEGWRMFLSNPILGVGKDNSFEFSETYHVPHNSFIHVAVELGVFGFLIWTGLIYFSFKVLYETGKLYVDENQASRGFPTLHIISDSVMVSMIGFVSTALFLSRQYGYLPYMLMALSVGVYQLANKQKGIKFSLSFKDLFFIVLLTLIFFAGWIMILKVFL